MNKIFKTLLCAITIISFGGVGHAAIPPKHRDGFVQDDERYIFMVGQRQQTISVYLTGYSYWDNTPPGSAAIARPVVHGSAGGSGTYNDPITIAVGYSLASGQARLDFPAGTRFYFPSLKRYAIVEDVCGNGPTPERTGCHRGRGGLPWLDIYVDGSRSGPGQANQCMNRITGQHKIIVNPKKGYPVIEGALTESGCGRAMS